jgi:inward rectifier potassium channel
MAILRKISLQANAEINTGFGENSSDYGGRFVNKDGEPNVEKKGVGYFERISWYHTLLQIPTWKFLSIIFIFFIVINLLFASLYYVIGVDQLSGLVYDFING